MSEPTESPAMLHEWPDADENGGIDETLLHWMLSLTPDQRLSVLEAMADAILRLLGDDSLHTFRNCTLKIIDSPRI